MWAEALMTTTDYQMETVFASLLAHFGTGGLLQLSGRKQRRRLVHGPVRHREQRSATLRN